MFIKTFVLFFLIVSFAYSVEYSQNVKDKKIYPIAQKIYNKKCQEIKSFSSKDELAVKIKNSCKKLKPIHNEYLNIYLWDNKNSAELNSLEFVKIKENDKCPICGMWVYKYPKWIAQIQVSGNVFSFDGVKDMMKYYLSHIDKSANIVLRDYYSQKPIDARKSFFVIGSDVFGPMGNELIPFINYDDANTFLMDHKGIKILKFNDIKKDDLEI